MRQFLCVLLSLAAGVASVGIIAGCGSGTQEVHSVPNAAPPKGSFPDAIQNNPNIPDAAKRAMLNPGGRQPTNK